MPANAAKFAYQNLALGWHSGMNIVANKASIPPSFPHNDGHEKEPFSDPPSPSYNDSRRSIGEDCTSLVGYTLLI